MRHRTPMSKRERHCRSKLMSLLRAGPVLRATLSVLRNTCGKPNCRCAKGERHESLYVSQSRRGKKHARCVPKAMRPKVKRWVARYKEIRELLEQLSQQTWEQLDEPDKD